jgi:hypothetical protein
MPVFCEGDEQDHTLEEGDSAETAFEEDKAEEIESKVAAERATKHTGSEGGAGKGNGEANEGKEKKKSDTPSSSSLSSVEGSKASSPSSPALPVAGSIELTQNSRSPTLSGAAPDEIEGGGGEGGNGEGGGERGEGGRGGGERDGGGTNGLMVERRRITLSDGRKRFNGFNGEDVHNEKGEKGKGADNGDGGETEKGAEKEEEKSVKDDVIKSSPPLPQTASMPIPCNCQVVRSACTWSIRSRIRKEMSIQNAYVHTGGRGFNNGGFNNGGFNKGGSTREVRCIDGGKGGGCKGGGCRKGGLDVRGVDVRGVDVAVGSRWEVLGFMVMCYQSGYCL